MKTYCWCIGFLFFLQPFFAWGQAEEYYGPFRSWTNLRTAYLAKGDGMADDTRALQMALDNLGKGESSPVLYIPNGVYRITATLTMQSARGIALIGEDPEKTIIKWDGPAGGKMFLLNGVAYSEYSRMTWDGSSRALAAVAHEWDGKTGPANSGSRHCDEIFRNLGIGLKSGSNMDAEVSIRRCRFYNCSSTAIALQGWNALDWWIWDCYFENCNVGVANDLPAFGAGNFHVYRSIFKYSATADISMGNSSFFSFRNNISYNSNAFIRARQFSNTSPITLQDNLVINRRNLTLVNLFTKGNILLLDNTFYTAPTPDSGTNNIIWIVDNFGSPPPDATLIGNRFSTIGWTLERYGGRFLIRDNQYGVAPAPLPRLDPVPFAPLVAYPVQEITSRMNTEQIQAFIDEAAASGKKVLFHFAYGRYRITHSLRIPSGAPLILYGDGLITDLVWEGVPGQPVFRVESPAMATLRSFSIHAGGGADGVLLEDNDQEGNSLYGEELMLYNGHQSNLWVNGFSHTDFRFEDLHHNYCASGHSVQMTGTGRDNASILKIFAAVSVNNANCYSVASKGRILVYDNWNECGLNVPFVSLRGSGEFILNGAVVANETKPLIPLIDIDSFSGKAIFTQILYNQAHKKFRFHNESGSAELLNLGILLASDSTMDFYDVSSPAARYSLVNNRYNIGKGSYPLPDLGDTSVTFVEKMLSVIRANTVSARIKTTAGNAHFTIDRVMIEAGVNNFRVERATAKNAEKQLGPGK